MSTYNMVNGTHPLAGTVLAMLGKSHEEFPRFRDAYVLRDPNRLVVMTRTGGGNREDYEAENKAITEMPGYLSDEDDGFDSTFAHWFFEVPEEHRELVDKQIAACVAHPDIDENILFRNPMDNFRDKVGAMGASR